MVAKFQVEILQFFAQKIKKTQKLINQKMTIPKLIHKVNSK